MPPKGPTVLFDGPVEVDEAYFGGKKRNKHEKDKLKAGRGNGRQDRRGGREGQENQQGRPAKVVESAGKATLQGFVADHAAKDADVFTDEASAYEGLANHAAVRHSVGQYVSGHVHTNGVESFWSMLKRAHKGTFHKLSPKHLQRYVDEFSGRHNIRELDTIEQMAAVTGGLMGRYLPYRTLVRNNGLSAGARA